MNRQTEGEERWSQHRPPPAPLPQRWGWRALTCLLPTRSTQVFGPDKRVMNHSQSYFQTLTPIVGPVPIPTLEVVVPTHHLSYCFLNFPFTLIFLGWRKTILIWVLRRQAAQGHRRCWLQVVSEWLMEQVGKM